MNGQQPPLSTILGLARMNVYTAFEIVISLAQQASVSDKEAEQDPEALKPLASMQQEAIKVVSDFFDRIGR